MSFPNFEMSLRSQVSPVHRHSTLPQTATATVTATGHRPQAQTENLNELLKSTSSLVYWHWQRVAVQNSFWNLRFRLQDHVPASLWLQYHRSIRWNRTLILLSVESRHTFFAEEVSDNTCTSQFDSCCRGNTYLQCGALHGPPGPAAGCWEAAGIADRSLRCIVWSSIPSPGVLPSQPPQPQIANVDD